MVSDRPHSCRHGRARPGHPDKQGTPLILMGHGSPGWAAAAEAAFPDVASRIRAAGRLDKNPLLGK